MNFEHIEDNAFQGRSFLLDSLEIDTIPIKRLTENTFKHLDELLGLQLIHTNVNTFEGPVFKPFKKLNTFTLQHCGPGEISIDNLFGTVELEHLRVVTVQFCRLKTTITRKTFTQLKGITKLNLRFNWIERIGENAFDVPMQTLNYLYLGDNHLKTLSANLFKVPIITDDPREYIMIQLGHNMWNCDCEGEVLRSNLISIMKSEKPKLVFSEFLCRDLIRKRFIRFPESRTFCPKKSITSTIDSTPSTDKITETTSVTTTSSTTLIETTKHQTDKSTIQTGNTNGLIENQIEIISSNVTVQCKTWDSSKESVKSVQFVKPVESPIRHMPIEDGNVFIDIDAISHEMIGLESDNGRNLTKCFINNRMGKFGIQFKMSPDRMYQFCWTQKGKWTISMLDCISFYSNILAVDAWILEEQKPVFIAVSVLVVFSAFFIGIFISYLLAKYFPKTIRGIEPKLSHSNSTKSDKFIITNGDMSVREYDEETIYESLEIRSAQFLDIPPMLPPRDKKKTLDLDKFNCCNSKNCECYVEI